MELRLGVGSFVNNDTVPLIGHTVRPPTAGADRGVRTADCGRRSKSSQVAFNKIQWKSHCMYTYKEIKTKVKIKKCNVQCPLNAMQSGCTR